MLYGRSAERRLIDDLLDEARRGRSGGLVLRGEAGIGKSTLLAYAAEQAGTARVLDLHGVQTETAMPFAGLHALLYLVRTYLPSLSEPQGQALSAALGIATGEVPSRFLVSAAVVELLAVLAEERPVVCLVDDAQWVDPQSLGALTFAQRRLRGDRVAMLFALRVEAPAEQSQAARLLADLPQATVGPLDDPSVERLLDGRPELDRASRTAVKQAARNNPLALTVLDPGGHVDLPVAPPSLKEYLEADYLRRTDGLDRRVRHLLLIAAADDTGDLAVLLAAAPGPAEDVASELAAVAVVAVRRSAGDLAARAYAQAAGLTADPQRRFGWLLDAAEAAWESGQIEHASNLLTRARELPAPDDRDPGRLDHLRGRLEAVTGSALQGYEILVESAERILGCAPDRAAAMLYAALRTASVAGDMDRVVRAGQVADQLLATGSRPAPARFAAAIADLLTGHGQGAVAALEEGVREVQDTSDPEMLYMAAVAALFAGDFLAATCSRRARSACAGRPGHWGPWRRHWNHSS